MKIKAVKPRLSDDADALRALWVLAVEKGYSINEILRALDSMPIEQSTSNTQEMMRG